MTPAVGQTWEMGDNDGGRFLVVVDAVGPRDVVAIRVQGGRTHIFSRRTMEKGMRNARLVVDANGVPVPEAREPTKPTVADCIPTRVNLQVTDKMRVAYGMRAEGLPTSAISSRFGISRATAMAWVSTWRAHIMTQERKAAGT